jgi:simple sugar transport system substrate-binding protein
MDNPISETNGTPKKSRGKIVVLAIVIIVIVGVGAAYLISPKIFGQTFPSGKMCSGVKVDFFAGGNTKDTFASVVYAGARQAQSDLGPDVNYIWSNWDSDTMVSQFKDAVAALPDAIAVMGHPGAAALGPLIDEAERKNIIVTMQNVDIPDVREKYTSNGFGYVGQNLYNSGLLVASGMIRKYQPAAGSEAVVFGVDQATDPSRYERTQGCIDGLTKGKLVVHEVTIPPEVQTDATSSAAQKLFADSLAKYPNAKIVLVDHGALTAASPILLKNIGKKPGDIILAGFDLSADTVTGIKNGYIGLILDQQPYLQGYLPILQSCLTKKFGFAGLYIDTGVGLIDSTNVDAVASLAAKGIR